MRKVVGSDTKLPRRPKADKRITAKGKEMTTKEQKTTIFKNPMDTGQPG
jgi:hypothetical protein